MLKLAGEGLVGHFEGQASEGLHNLIYFAIGIVIFGHGDQLELKQELAVLRQFLQGIPSHKVFIIEVQVL